MVSSCPELFWCLSLPLSFPHIQWKFSLFHHIHSIGHTFSISIVTACVQTFVTPTWHKTLVLHLWFLSLLLHPAGHCQTGLVETLMWSWVSPSRGASVSLHTHWVKPRLVILSFTGRPVQTQGASPVFPPHILVEKWDSFLYLSHHLCFPCGNRTCSPRLSSWLLPDFSSNQVNLLPRIL